MAAKTRYTVTIDTEEEWDWNSGYPTQSNNVENIKNLHRLQDVIDKHNAKSTYFTNHTVLADPASCDIMMKLADRPNVEIGLHLHPWNTPPFQKMEKVPTRDSFLHNLEWELAEAKLDSLFTAAKKAGLEATSYRGGRYSMSPKIQNYLRDHGIIADSSVMPYSTWPDDGAPDYRNRGPYPKRLDPRHAGDQAMWELPLTYGYVGRLAGDLNRKMVELFDKPPFPRMHAGGILRRLTGSRKCWLNLENSLGEGMTDLFPVIRQQQLPFVCFTMHSSSLLAGGSPYCPTQAHVEKLLSRADATLAAVARELEFEPSTITETVHSLEAQHHAGHRHQPIG